MRLSDAFTRSAHRYDVLAGLNPGYRRELRAAARDLATGLDESKSAPRIWDLGCGSGLSTQALLEALPRATVTGLDASAGMLDQARAKTWPATTRFQLGRTEDLSTVKDQAFAEDPDGVFAAYLFRNLAPDAKAATLAAIIGRLRPGGHLVLHDYSVVESRRAKLVWTLVCWLIVIPLSRLVGAEPSLYRYLWRSVLANDSTHRVMQWLHEAGFEDVAVRTGHGWHRRILHTYIARKPHATGSREPA